MSLAIAGIITRVGTETRGQYLTIHPKVHTHIMLTHLNIKQGLSTFGERGSEAVLKELRQLHHKKALLPLQQANLTIDKRKKALRYLMFLKEK